MGVVAVTEPSGGSDVAGTQTTAKLEGDKYVLNGRKCFITNSHHSDIWVVIARTGEGGKGLSHVVVEKDFPAQKLGARRIKLACEGPIPGRAFQQLRSPERESYC